jgi:hypothetical protein
MTSRQHQEGEDLQELYKQLLTPLHLVLHCKTVPLLSPDLDAGGRRHMHVTGKNVRERSREAWKVERKKDKPKGQNVTAQKCCSQKFESLAGIWGSEQSQPRVDTELQFSVGK